jgi:protocadherin Fat 1/2/3
VAEGSPVNTIVDGLENLYAKDRDTSGIRSYRIISGNERGYFQASTTSVGGRQFLQLKTTSTPIVRDPNTPYITLTIEAQDGGIPSLFGRTKVKIAIEDSNNNSPRFVTNQYFVTIPENTPLMTKVIRVRATDNDVGTNGGIYYFMNPLDEYFTVDAITGVIKVVRELDYSAKRTFFLQVYARDRGSPYKTTSAATVTINLYIDIPGYPPPATPNPGKNTNPYFGQPRYTFSIREDFPVKGALLSIRASDNDPIGPNKRLRYSLSSTDKFSIDANSGVVTLNKIVDYESESRKHKLTVTAFDHGSPALKATTELVVEIQDVDENHFSPKFDPKQAVVSVKEDTANNTVVYTATATDGDTGSNGKVVYYLEEGSGLGYFRIDSTNGKVSVAALLDRERQSSYELVITARDSATFPRSSRMLLMIKITDVNDNNPYFTQPMYLAKVPDKTAENTFVTVILARDPDVQARLSYTLTDTSKNFKVDPQTGVVRTARSLEGSVRKFELSVTASSGQIAKGQLNITVTSKADKPPVFKNLPYKVTVPENMGVVPNLMCIAAVDSNSQQVKYVIASGADNVFGLEVNSGKSS